MGARVGEKRSFQITFPDDYPVELWQGMQAKVDISVRESFEWVLPAVCLESAPSVPCILTVKPLEHAGDVFCKNPCLSAQHWYILHIFTAHILR